MAGETGLGAIIVSIEAQYGKLAEGLKSAEEKVSGFTQKANQLLETHYKKVLAVGASISTVYILMAKQGMNYVLSVERLSKISGVGTEELSKLAYAARQEGVSMEELSRVLPLLTKAMDFARTNVGDYAQEFARLGITVTDSNGRLKRTTDVLLEMADYFSKTTDKQQAMLTASTLLGAKLGKEFIPFLSQGRDKIKELGDELEKLGGVVNSVTAQKMKAFADTMDSVRVGLVSIGVDILTLFKPALDALANALKAALEWFHGLNTGMQNMLIIIPLTVGGFLTLAGAVGLFKVVLLPGLVTGIKAVGASLLWLVTSPIGLTISALALFATVWFQNWGNIQSFVKNVAQKIGDAFDWMVERFFKMIFTMKNLSEMPLKEKLLHPIEAFKKALAEADAQFKAMKQFENVAGFGDRFAEGVQKAIDKTQELKDLLAGKQEMESGPGSEERVEKTTMEVDTRSFEAAFANMKGIMASFRGSWIGWTDDLKTTWKVVVTSVEQTLGNSIATMIKEGGKFKDAMKAFWEDLKNAVIDAISQMIAKWLVFLALKIAGSFLGFKEGGILIGSGEKMSLPSAQEGAMVLGPGAVPILVHPPEAIIPLDKFDEMRNASKAGNTYHLSFSFEGAQISNEIDIDDLSARLGDSVKRALRSV